MQEITAVQSLSVTRLPVTEKALPDVQSFAYAFQTRRPGEHHLDFLRASVVIVTLYITSLRLRRNAGTSRSSCSKLPVRLVSTPPRIESSEMTSATRSAACAAGTGSSTYRPSSKALSSPKLSFVARASDMMCFGGSGIGSRDPFSG